MGGDFNKQEDAQGKLAHEREDSSELDSITEEKERELKDKRQTHEIISDMGIRGKALSEKALESEEFKLLTAKKYGTEKEYEKTKEVFDKLVEEYEEINKHQYVKQLDPETGIEDYAEMLHEHL